MPACTGNATSSSNAEPRDKADTKSAGQEPSPIAPQMANAQACHYIAAFVGSRDASPTKMTLITLLGLRENRSYFRSRNWSREYLRGAQGRKRPVKPQYGEAGQGQRRRETEWELSAAQGWARPSPSALPTELT